MGTDGTDVLWGMMVGGFIAFWVCYAYVYKPHAYGEMSTSHTHMVRYLQSTNHTRMVRWLL